MLCKGHDGLSPWCPPGYVWPMDSSRFNSLTVNLLPQKCRRMCENTPVFAFKVQWVISFISLELDFDPELKYKHNHKLIFIFLFLTEGTAAAAAGCGSSWGGGKVLPLATFRHETDLICTDTHTWLSRMDFSQLSTWFFVGCYCLFF